MRTYFVFLICIGLALGKKVPKRSADEPFTLTFGNGGSGSGTSGTGSGSPSGSSTGGGGCSYKGQTYSQGQTWKDGCDYNCQCTDGSVGRYQCRSVCPQYTNLPAQCTLVKDANGCCSTPQCNFQSSGGAGSGSGTSGSGSSGTGTFTLTQTGSGSCSDKLTNCAEYGQSVCTNSNYATWVHDNCCAYCGGSSSSGSSSGTGSQTGGMTGTGTSGSGSSGSGGDPFQLVFNTQAPGTISGSGSGTGTGSCSDRLSNCPQYGRDVCTNSNYATWVHDNCCAYCAGGSGSGSSGSGTSGSGTSGTGSSGSGSSGSGGDPFQLVFQTQAPGTISGSGSGSSSCADSLPNCAAYTKATCTDPNYDRWVRDHCAKYCNKCGSLPGTGSGSATGTGSGGTSGTGGLPVAQPGRVITGFGPVSGGGSGTGTMTGGTGTGTGGTGTGTSGGTGGSFTFTNCMDKSTSCSLMESQQHICTTASARVYAQQNCAKTCNMCSGSSTGTGGAMTGTGSGGTMTGTGTGTCRDSIPNCKDYTQATCTNSNYATWVSKNCPAYCNKCSSMSGGGTMTGTGTGSGTMTGTGTGTVTGTGTGGTITGTGTGTGGGISGQSTGCVYKSKIYQQGQTWKDACQYSCSCTNASTGQYQCSSLCVTWNLPSACHLSPPGPGKCCPTPSCPPGYNIQYPAGYVAN